MDYNYREEVMRNCKGFEDVPFKEKLSLAGLGIAGEGGEVADVIKKVLHHDTPLDKDKLIKEMGDVRWYLEYLCATLDITMEDVEERNVKKLRARYPDGFTKEAANKPRGEE